MWSSNKKLVMLTVKNHYCENAFCLVSWAIRVLLAAYSKWNTANMTFLQGETCRARRFFCVFFFVIFFWGRGGGTCLDSLQVVSDFLRIQNKNCTTQKLLLRSQSFTANCLHWIGMKVMGSFIALWCANCKFGYNKAGGENGTLW